MIIWVKVTFKLPTLLFWCHLHKKSPSSKWLKYKSITVTTCKEKLKNFKSSKFLVNKNLVIIRLCINALFLYFLLHAFRISYARSLCFLQERSRKVFLCKKASFTTQSCTKNLVVNKFQNKKTFPPLKKKKKRFKKRKINKNGNQQT